MKTRIIVLISILSVTACKNKNSNEGLEFSKITETIIQKLADSLLLDSKINAVSIGVYKNGKKHIAHYGELDKGIGNTPTDETLYEIASVSKTFTGVLVSKAVLEGKLSLEDDVQTYLKEEYSNLKYDGAPIKIKHLLTHTSRLPRFLPDNINSLLTEFNESLPFKMYEIQKNYSKKEFFADLQTVVLDTIPGTRYGYSNVDTELIAHILENIYDTPFDELLKEYFGKIANMPNTKIKLSKKEKLQLANGYGMTNKLVPHEANSLFGADGGIKSTMPDLVNYIAFQLNTKNTIVSESHKVIYEKGNRKMSYYWPIKSNEEYGTYFRHHGGSFGTQNWIIIIPKYNFGVSIITNQSDLDTADKLMAVVNQLILEIN